MVEETFTVISGGVEASFADFDTALLHASPLLDGPDPVTILSSTGARWEGSDITSLLD